LLSCRKCGGKAVYERRYSGEILCKACFTLSIRERTRRTISRFNMLNHGERVAVALSGGKDSLMLLKILSEICRPHGTRLFAVTVDEGVRGYRDESVRISIDFCRSLNVPQRIVSYEELYGSTLDDALLRRNGVKSTSCSICGTLRRRAIDVVAKELNVDVVATAHNLDDFIQTHLINVLTGNLERISALKPVLEPSRAYPVRRVKPFVEIYEQEIALCAYLEGIPLQAVACPYMNEGIRTDVRNFLNRLEEKHPGIKYTMLRTVLESSRRLAGSLTEFATCIRCGNPSKNGLCSVCQTLQILQITRSA